MRLIDADKLIKQRQFIIAEAEGLCGDIVWVRDIQAAPTIDAMTVVRCKDCKYRPTYTGGKNYGQDLVFPDKYCPCPCMCDDPWYSWMPQDDWFCANGERSEE